MRNIFLAFVFILTSAAPVLADEHVNGYTRSDGTYVAPYERSSPDNSYNNNWGVQGNTNPYTGREGTAPRTENDRSPAYNEQHYGSPMTEDSGASE